MWLFCCLLSSTEPPDDDDDDNDENLTQAQQFIKAKFMAADTNNDSVLDIGEFTPFIHPFRHTHMVVHLIDDQLLTYDLNNDGIISLDEYLREYAT